MHDASTDPNSKANPNPMPGDAGPRASVIETLLRLAEDDPGPWVTVTLPLEGGGAEARGDALRFRGLVDRARERLASRGGASELAATLDGVAAESEPFAPSRGSFLFVASPRRTYREHLPVRLPERATVDDAPALLPLVEHLDPSGDFLVLVVALHGARLLRGDRLGLEELPLPDEAPRRLEDAAGWDLDETHLQQHTAGPGKHAAGGDRWSAQHGHGGGDDDRDVDVEKYLRALDRALVDALGPSPGPVVLACDPGVEGAFRRVTSLRDVLEPAVHDNHERTAAEKLHAEAWARVAPRLEAASAAARQRWFDVRGDGRAIAGVEDVVPAAAQGRVASLLVRRGAAVEGRLDPETTAVQLDAGGAPPQDLVERAAAETLRHGGEVRVLDPESMPADAPVAAVLRW